MINKDTIAELYKKYSKRPKDVQSLDFGTLLAYAMEFHGIELDDEMLTIDSIDSDSPFRSIPLRNIHAIVEFDSYIAIVLHSAIIFLNKNNSEAAVHIKMNPQGIWDKLKWCFEK